MASYCRVYDSRHLQADCKEPASAPDPTLGILVWATFTFTFLQFVHSHISKTTCFVTSCYHTAEAHPNCPVMADVFERPPPRLASRCPIWSDMTSVDTITQCREDWSSASVVNHTIVTDPTIRQPDFDLPRHTWSLMNRFRTG